MICWCFSTVLKCSFDFSDCLLDHAGGASKGFRSLGLGFD